MCTQGGDQCAALSKTEAPQVPLIAKMRFIIVNVLTPLVAVGLDRARV